VQYDLLASVIPALSYSMAATDRIQDAKGNFDMQGTMRTDNNKWPTEKRSGEIKSGKWLHSDMRDVAFLHVYQLYQKFITTGNLNQ